MIIKVLKKCSYKHRLLLKCCLSILKRFILSLSNQKYISVNTVNQIDIFIQFL